MTISFIIPVKHDARVIVGVHRLRTLINRQGLDAEIITIGELAPQLATYGDRHIQIQPAYKGACVRAGVLASDRQIIVALDADVPVSDADILALIAGARVYDIVVGSRSSKGRVHSRRALSRTISSYTFRILIDCFFDLKGIDTQSGAKAFRGSAARAIVTDHIISGLAYDVELLWRARQEGMSILEVPVMWLEGLSTIRLWSAIPTMMWEIGKLLFHRILISGVVFWGLLVPTVRVSSVKNRPATLRGSPADSVDVR